MLSCLPGTQFWLATFGHLHNCTLVFEAVQSDGYFGIDVDLQEELKCSIIVLVHCNSLLSSKAEHDTENPETVRLVATYYPRILSSCSATAESTMSAAISPSKVFSTAPLPPDCVFGISRIIQHQGQHSGGGTTNNSSIYRSLSVFVYICITTCLPTSQVCEYSWDNGIFLFDIY